MSASQAEHEGSIPFTRSSIKVCPCGSVVEHSLGKGEVMRSIRITGTSNFFRLTFFEYNPEKFPAFVQELNHGKREV